MHVLRVSVCLATCLLHPGLLVGDEGHSGKKTEPTPPALNQPVQPADPTRSAAEKKNSEALTPNEKLEQRQKGTLAGFLMLGLVCLVFLFFVAAVSVTSRRLRKEATTPLSKSPQADPLWYLKNRKQPGEASGKSEGEGEGTATSDEPN